MWLYFLSTRSPRANKVKSKEKKTCLTWDIRVNASQKNCISNISRKLSYKELIRSAYSNSITFLLCVSHNVIINDYVSIT